MPSASRRANSSSGVSAMRPTMRRRRPPDKALRLRPHGATSCQGGFGLYDARRSAAAEDLSRCGRSSGVEHNLAKVGVEGSNPFARSNYETAKEPRFSAAFASGETRSLPERELGRRKSKVSTLEHGHDRSSRWRSFLTFPEPDRMDARNGSLARCARALPAARCARRQTR